MYNSGGLAVEQLNVMWVSVIVVIILMLINKIFYDTLKCIERKGSNLLGMTFIILTLINTC